jgi:hypothetical protein
MSLPQAFPIDSTGALYYNNKDLFEYKKTYYYGTISKPKNIVDKKNIPTEEYVHANLKAGEWNQCGADCKKSQLLISANWADKHILEIERCVEMTQLPVEMSFQIQQLKDNELREAPPLLLLNEDEKFRDDEGNVVVIETRGEKSEKEILFRVKDVMAAFQMPNLECTIRDERKTYEKNIDYKYFIRTEQVIGLSDTNKKELFLTYSGIIRVLIISRAGIADKFKKWAMETLFVVQMGSKDEKFEHVAGVLKVTKKTLRALFSTHAKVMPCIYLIYVGKAGKIRDSLQIETNLPDDADVYKYGFSKDFAKRIGNHELGFGKLPGVDIRLTSFQVIDPLFVGKAEKDVGDVCELYGVKLNIGIRCSGYTEFISLNARQLEDMKKRYSHIGKECEGHNAQLKEELESYKQEIKDLNNALEKKNLEIKSNNEKHEIEVKNLNEKHALEVTHINETYELKLLLKDAEIEKNVMIIQLKNMELKLKDSEIEKIQRVI